MSAAKYLQDEAADRSASAQLVRLLIAPVAVTLLLAGGVYWLRLQPPAGAGSHEQLSTIQVHLIPHPDPALIPTPAPSPVATSSVADRTAPSRDDLDDAPVAVPPTPAVLPSQVAPSSVGESPAPTTAPPSKAALQFQQALLRHIGRYQRYPAAARQGRLQGTVQTFFSVRRDGTLLDVWVKTSSGQPVLDKEAIDTVRRAQPLPPIPPDLPDRLNIQVQLAFDPY